jgi:hypothetical protein
MTITSGIDWQAGLGYDPREKDELVLRARRDIEHYRRDPRGTVMSWGVPAEAFTDEVRGRIEELHRSFRYAEPRLLAALARLNKRAIQVRKDYPADVARYLKSFMDNEVMAAIQRGDEVAVASVTALVQPNVVAVNQTNSTADGIPFQPVLDQTVVTEATIPRAELRVLVNDIRDAQRQYQIAAQAMVLDEQRLTTQARWDFYFAAELAANELKIAQMRDAARAQQAKSDGGSGLIGDVFGMVSAVTGVLALIPVLTPVMGPIALVTGAVAFSANAASMAMKGDWDDPTAWAGLGADALSMVPGVGAVAKGAKAAKAAAKGATAATGSMRAAGRIARAARTGGRVFLGEVAGSGAAEASKLFTYVGNKAASVGGRAMAKQGTTIAKVLQGSVDLATQVPVALELSAGASVDTAKDAATDTSLIVSYGNSIGSWGAVGSAAKKGGKGSLALFASIIGGR